MRGEYRLYLRFITAAALVFTSAAPALFAQVPDSAVEAPGASSQADAPFNLFEGELPAITPRAAHTTSRPAPQTEPAVTQAQFQQAFSEDDWTLQFAPTGLLYKSYLAGEKESRISTTWLVPRNGDHLIWETTLGGRIGILRYGNTDPLHPEGWQLDLEGGALLRLDPQGVSTPLQAVDFRFGILSTWRVGNTAIKAGYYHLSSHAGDEFLINNPTFERRNYVRDSGIIGITQYLDDDWSVYGEVAYAFGAEDGAKPIELQYGIQYAPLIAGWPGTPFAAVNGHTREDFGYITSVNIEAGWMFRSKASNRTLRLGMQYYDGPSIQWEFVQKHESLMGAGIWFDY
jgi:hypothetical protein